MLLTKNYNVIIALVKHLLFIKHSMPLTRGAPNKLSIEVKKATTAKGLAVVTVTLEGAWVKLVKLRNMLWQVFYGCVDKVLLMQARYPQESFIIMNQYCPKDSLTFTFAPFYDDTKSQWVIPIPEESGPDLSIKTLKAEYCQFIIKTSLPTGKNMKAWESLTKNFLRNTCFVFYEISVSFQYWGEPFIRDALDIPVPRSLTKKITKFFRSKLGVPESIGSAWMMQSQRGPDLQPIQIAGVSYSLPGQSYSLPVWVLGPAGTPVPTFSKVLFRQLISEASGASPDECDYEPPLGFPPSDVCIKLSSENALCKRTNLVVLLLLVPDAANNYKEHENLMDKFDAIASHYWDCIVETIKEVLEKPTVSPEQSGSQKLCHSIASSFSSIFRLSLNNVFREQCFQKLEVMSALEAGDTMEERLEERIVTAASLMTKILSSPHSGMSMPRLIHNPFPTDMSVGGTMEKKEFCSQNSNASSFESQIALHKKSQQTEAPLQVSPLASQVAIPQALPQVLQTKEKTQADKTSQSQTQKEESDSNNLTVLPGGHNTEEIMNCEDFDLNSTDESFHKLNGSFEAPVVEPSLEPPRVIDKISI